MKKIQILALVMLLSLLLTGCSVLLRRPLGPQLQLTQPPTQSPIAAQPLATRPPTEPTQPPPAPTALPGVVTTEATATCGQGALNLLVLGQADPATPGQRGADAIRLVHVEFDQPSLSSLAVPPDLLAPAPTPAALTQTYWQALQSAEGDDTVRHSQATRALAQALLESYGYAPDNYITVNQQAFVQIIDALGGIQVDIPQAITEVPAGWHTFQPGLQTLTGDQALDYVRLLNPTGAAYTSEWDRFDRQNQVLQGLLAAVVNPANWDSIPQLIAAFQTLLVTDLSLEQLFDLTCVIKEAGSQASQIELPVENATTDADGRILVDPALVRDLIAQLEE